MTLSCCTSRGSLLLLLVLASLPRLYYSWTCQTSFRFSRNLALEGTSSSSSNDENDDTIHRLSIAGASVSPTGFWIILSGKDENTQYWPIQVTVSEEDKVAATSLESLTLLQLLAGVDMAGAIFPPERLSQLAILAAEEESNKLNFLLQQLKLPDNVPYSELSEWQQARVRLPQVTLDKVLLDIHETPTWTLQCMSGGERFDFSPMKSAHDNSIAVAFVCLALQLRYHAPLLLSSNDDTTTWYSLDDVEKEFPLYQSVAELQKPARRVESNVKKSWEIHKLTGALKVAMKRKDQSAVEKIRAALDKYDSMEELPTTKQFETSDYDALQ